MTNSCVQWFHTMICCLSAADLPGADPPPQTAYSCRLRHTREPHKRGVQHVRNQQHVPVPDYQPADQPRHPHRPRQVPESTSSLSCYRAQQLQHSPQLTTPGLTPRSCWALQGTTYWNARCRLQSSEWTQLATSSRAVLKSLLPAPRRPPRVRRPLSISPRLRR